MFGCGNYFVWFELRKFIDWEVCENVKFFRYYFFIVIWVGNNEDYQYQEFVGLIYDFENKDVEFWFQIDFLVRYIYEKIFSDVCVEFILSIFYYFGSLWGVGRDIYDVMVGDIYQWNVWYGIQEKWQDFDKFFGRFVSEFGMQVFLDVKIIDVYLFFGKDDLD